MAKERRAAHARADGGANYGGTPYERPSARGRRENNAEGGGSGLGGPGEIQASSSSLQALADQERDDRAEKRSLWKSIVTTPYKALKTTFNVLSGSPTQDTGTQPQDGAAGPREASSTAAVLANGPQDEEEKVADRDSIHLDQDMRSPSPPQGASPTASGAPGTGDRASSYDHIRAQSASLLAQTPVSSSPFLRRARPGSGQSSGAQLGQSAGPPGRLSQGLEPTPAPSPLALTPIPRPPRATPRARRPFSRTPVRLPLAAGGASYEAPSSSSPEQAPAPMAWTPMRASALAPAAGAGSGLRSFGLKRLREGEAPSAPGTPLLQAGLASEAGRRTRQRSDKAVGSAERRVWRAGATPFPGRVGSAGSSPGDAAPVPSRLAAASSREPTPMTESARRIAQALDSMTKQVPLPAAPVRTPPGPPPTDSLGAFVPPPSFTQGKGHPQQKPLLLGPGSMSQPARFGTHSTAADLRMPPQPLAIGRGPAAGSAEADGDRPKADAGVSPFGAWGKYTQRAGASSGPAAASTGSPAWGLTPAAAPSFGKTAAISGQQDEVETPKFKFRPARPLSDSAEKLRLQQQRQREEASEAEAAPPPAQAAQAPAASEVAALNAKAEAAAAQPLPDSDDSEDEALGVVRGNLRTGGPRENGNATDKAQPQEASQSATPAASGWGTDFLKQNTAAQASQSAAIAKKIAEKQAPALPSLAGAFQPTNNSEKGTASKPEPAAASGWGADFLKSNQDSVAKANAAVAAAIEESDSAAKAAPGSAPWTFGKPASEPPSASTSSGLLGFLGTITPGAGPSGFAPSTSSGFSLGAMAAAGSAAGPGSMAFPAFILPAADGLKSQDQDGPLKKQAKRGRADAESEEADGVPASKAITFGLPAFPSKAPGQAKAGSGLSLPGSGPAFGQGPFSFGAAPAKLAEADKDTKQPEADQGSAPAGSAAALEASQAPSMPKFLGFGAKGTESAPGDKLSADAKPFAPSFGAGGLLNFGAKKTPQDGDKDKPEGAEAGSGLALTEGVSGHSIDSNMSISPVAASAAAAINPFTAVDEVPAQPVPASEPGLPHLPAPSASTGFAAPKGSFLFGASAAAPAASSAPASDAAKPGLFASAGAFGAGSMPAFGGSALAFGSRSDAPLFGAASSTPAFGQGSGAAPASGFNFGSGGALTFGAQNSGATFGASSATSAPRAAAPGSGSGFTFGGSAGPLTFGAESSAASSGAAASAPAFGASQQSTGGLFGASAPAATQQPAGQFAFGSAAHTNAQSAAAPAFGGGLPSFGAASAPAFGAGTSAPAFGAGSAPAPAFGAATAPAPAFGTASGAAPGFGAMPAFGVQSAPAFGATLAPAFGGASGPALGTGFAFGGSASQAQTPFGGMHSQPAFGQSSVVPTFGAQQAGQPANPFGQPGVAAFGQPEQPQPGAGNGGFPAPGGGLAGNNAGSMTLGLGEQRQGGSTMARRKFKAKRKQ